MDGFGCCVLAGLGRPWGAFNAMLDNDLARTAVDMDNFDPSKISPAAGPETKLAD